MIIENRGTSAATPGIASTAGSNSSSNARASVQPPGTWLTSTEIFSPELYFLSKLPAEIDVGETTAVVIMALTLSFLATLYPSWRAARLDPVEALRYE